MRKLLLMWACLAMAAGSAWGVWSEDSWIGSNLGDWATGSNWDTGNVPGTPTENEDWAIIDKEVGNGPLVSGTQKNVGGFAIRNGDLTIDGTGPVDPNNNLGDYVGCRRQFFVALDPGNVSNVTVNDGGTLTMGWDNSGAKGTYIGHAGTGTVTSWGRMYSASNIIRIGVETTGVGVVNIHQGNHPTVESLWTANRAGNNVFYVGYLGDGTINIDGGRIEIASRLDITSVVDSDYATNGAGSSYGHIEMSGGTIVADHLYMEVNALSLAANGGAGVERRGSIHQTGGEFIFTNQSDTTVNRVLQAIEWSKDYAGGAWWTTDPGLELVITPWDQSPDGFTHVTVIPEPVSMILFGLSILLLRRR